MRGTQKFSEPYALNNTPSLVTVGPNFGDGIVIMMSGAGHCAYAPGIDNIPIKR